MVCPTSSPMARLYLHFTTQRQGALQRLQDYRILEEVFNDEQRGDVKQYLAAVTADALKTGVLNEPEFATPPTAAVSAENKSHPHLSMVFHVALEGTGTP